MATKVGLCTACRASACWESIDNALEHRASMSAHEHYPCVDACLCPLTFNVKFLTHRQREIVC